MRLTWPTRDMRWHGQEQTVLCTRLAHSSRHCMRRPLDRLVVKSSQPVTIIIAHHRRPQLSSSIMAPKALSSSIRARHMGRTEIRTGPVGMRTAGTKPLSKPDVSLKQSSHCIMARSRSEICTRIQDRCFMEHTDAQKSKCDRMTMKRSDAGNDFLQPYRHSCPIPTRRRK